MKLRPKRNDFFAVGPVKLCLEENLRTHATLTIGDIVTIWYRGKAHALCVMEMKPSDGKGTLINSDVEVDLDLPEEESSIRSQQSQQSQQGKAKTISTNAFNSSVISTIDNSNNNNNAVRNEVVPINYVLPEEPGISDESIVQVRIRTPQHGTLSRRFSQRDPLVSLFQYTSQHIQVQPEQIQLALRFPAKTFQLGSISDSAASLKDFGICSPQEMFMASILS